MQCIRFHSFHITTTHQVQVLVCTNPQVQEGKDHLVCILHYRYSHVRHASLGPRIGCRVLVKEWGC